MNNIYIVKRELGDEICEALGYDEIQLDDKISLDLLFNKIANELDNRKYKIEDLEKQLYDSIHNPYTGSDELYEQSVGK